MAGYGFFKDRESEHICHEQFLIFMDAGNAQKVSAVFSFPEQQMTVVAESMHQEAVISGPPVSLKDEIQLPGCDLYAVCHFII